MSITLIWSRRYPASFVQNIYRGTAPFDSSSLPAVYATLSNGETSFQDTDATFVTGSYFYMVEAVNGANKAYSSLVQVNFDTGDGPPPVVLDPPTFGSSGAYAISASATSLSVAYPAVIEAGQLLVMAVMHRSTLTIPAGWTDEGRTAAFSTFGDGQRTQFISKVATGAESGSLNIVQSSSNRFIAQMYAVNPSFGDRSMLFNTGSQSSPVFKSAAIPVQTKKTLIFSALSIAQTLNSGSTSWTVESGWTRLTPFSSEGNRLVVAYREADVGFEDTDGVTFTHSNTTSTAFGIATMIIPEAT